MLPFARILEYANVAPKNGIKDIKTGVGNTVVLSGSGNLYVFGANNSGELGTGSTASVTGSEWLQIPIQGIDQIYAGWGCYVAVGNDNKVYLSGNLSSIGQSGRYTTFTDISTLFSSFNLKNDRIVMATNGIFVLTSTGDLYTIGQGTDSTTRSNNGSATVLSAFKLIASNVKDVYSTLDGGAAASFYLTNNNELYSTGKNDFGTCGVGYSGLVPTFTKVTFSKTIESIRLGYRSAFLFCSDSSVYVAGYAYYGYTANNTPSAAPLTSFTLNTSIPSGVVNNLKDISHSSFTEDGTVIFANDKSYSSGLNYFGRFDFNLPSGPVYYVLTPGVTDLSNYKCTIGNYHQAVWNDSTIYACGNGSAFPGLSGDLLVYKSVKIPF